MSSARDFEAAVRLVRLLAATPPRAAMTTLGVTCMAGVEATACDALVARAGRDVDTCPPRRLATTFGVSGRRRPAERAERELAEVAGIS